MYKQLLRDRATPGEPMDNTCNAYWKEQLRQRPNGFSATGESERNLSAYIQRGEAGYYFPLGTSDAETAAAKAQQIYLMAVNEGWDATCGQFPRELIVSFEWCMNPVLWTYTTVHTLVGEWGGRKSKSSPAVAAKQSVLVVEPDAGICQALCWCIDQQEGMASIPVATVESYARQLTLHAPSLVLLNRNLTGRIAAPAPGPNVPGQSKSLTLIYSVHGDDAQMFAGTPGDVESYLIKRVKPDRLLEPILKAGHRMDITHRDMLLRVKYFFQESLELRSYPDNSVLTKLTQRERETLKFLSKGFVDKEIAQAMGISAWTVHGHIKNIFERLQVRTRTEAVIRYLGNSASAANSPARLEYGGSGLY
jgi:DNA-binding NarL/FixJ family response regulator